MAVLALLLTACTMVGHQKVAGWPDLQTFEHYVPNDQMRDRCSKYVAFGMSPEACAEFSLAANRCDIWLSADFPPAKWVLEHERLHCKGYDHIGMDTMARLLARHRGAGGGDVASTGGGFASTGATAPAR